MREKPLVSSLLTIEYQNINFMRHSTKTSSNSSKNNGVTYSLFGLLLFLSLSILPITATAQFTEQIGQDVIGIGERGELGDVVKFSGDGTAYITVEYIEDDNNDVGVVSVYQQQSGAWVLMGSAINTEDVDGEIVTLAISDDGQTIAIGNAHDSTDQEREGTVKVYAFTGGDWVQQGNTLKGNNIYDHFGISIDFSADATYLVVGAHRPKEETDDPDNIRARAGYVETYKKGNSGWSQVGSQLLSGLDVDTFGMTVKLSEDASRLFVSNWVNTSGDGNTVFTYKNENDNWSGTGSLDGQGGLHGFDIATSFNGEILAIASYSSSSTGAVDVYKLRADALGNPEWTAMGSRLEGASGEGFGNSIDLTPAGYTLFVGAPRYQNQTTDKVGAVKVYNFLGGEWVMQDLQITGQMDGDILGHAVSASNDGLILAIGAPGVDANGMDRVGLVRVLADCPAGVTCTTQEVAVCGDSYDFSNGTSATTDGRYDIFETPIERVSYIVTFQSTEQGVDVFQNATIAESGTVTYQANTNATGVLSFDKTQDFWVNLNALQDDLDGKSRSVFMWVKAENNTTTNQALFAVNAANGDNLSFLWIDPSSDNLEVNRGGSTNESASYNMGDNTWHYVGWTYDHSTGQTITYVDGIENDRFTTGTSVPNASAQYSLGQEFDGNSISDLYNGDMAEISVWDEVLTGADIRQAMMAKINSGHPKYNNLVGYYSVFGDCNDTNDVLKDHSGKGNDGLMVNDFTVDFQNVQSIPCFNAIDWYEHISWKKDGAEVSTDPTYTFDVAAGSYELIATRNFVQSTDSWTMTLNSNATTADLIADETLCADDPITRTVSTSAVNYLDFEETEDNSVQLNALTDDIAGKSYSVFMWLNKESNIGSGDFNEVLVFQDSDVDNLSRFYIRDTERLALWDGTNDRLNSSVLSNDTWYFVGYTYDNATGETKLYLNGNVEDSGTLNMPLGDGWIATLGAKYNDNGLEDYLDGKMAEITIWDKVLTQEEVTSLMGAASAHDATNLVAAYGTHKNIADNLLRDLTDNGNNGLASHSSIFVTSHEAEITDYDASANYSFSWKKGGAEFDTDATGNIAVEEGTLQYSVTYGTPLFQKLDDFSLSYTNLIPTQPTGKTIASSTNVTFEVEEIPGASYQWYRREEGFDEINITGGLLNRDVYRAPDGTIYNATSTAGIYYTTDEGNTWVIRNTAHGLLIDDIKEIKIFDDNIYAVQINKAVSISKDGGNSFQTLFQVTPNASANLPQTVMKAEDGTIYIGALNGLHVSTDGGANFSKHSDVTGMVEVLYEVEGTLYVGSREGLFISNDNGANFVQKTITDGLAFNSIRDVYKSGNKLYVSTQTADFKDGAISISTNAGESFTKTVTEANGFNGNLVNAIYEFAGQLFVGTSRGLFVSSDQGDSFSQFPTSDPFTKTVKSLNKYNGHLEVGTLVGLSIYNSNLELEDQNSGSNNLIEGATTHQLTISNVTLEQSGNIYFVEVTKDGCKQQSDDLLLTVLDVPGVTSITPANESTDVAIDTELSIEFSKTVSKGTGELKIYDYGTDALIQILTANDLTIEGSTATVTSGVSLEYATQYYITLSADLVKDESDAGNLAMTNKDTWTFHTVCEPLVLTEPEDQTGVIGQSVTFSVPEVAGASYQWFNENDRTDELLSNIGSIASVSATSSGIFVGAATGLYRSTNDGESFAQLNDSTNINVVLEKNGILYVGYESGLGISTDNGETFSIKTTTNSDLPSNDIANISVFDNTLFLSISDASINGGVIVSTNNGESFVRKTSSDGLGSNEVYDVFAAGDNIYVATKSGLSISTNGGNSFENKTSANGLKNNNVRNVVVSANGTIYAGTSSGMSISTDGGATFTDMPTNSELASSIVRDLEIDNDLVYIAVRSTSGGAGIYSTNDGGQTLNTVFEEGFAGYRSVAISVLNNKVYAGGVASTLLSHSSTSPLVSGSDATVDNYISGANTRELTISNLTEDFDQTKYFVVVTKGICEETSELITLTLSDAPIPITITSLNPNNGRQKVSRNTQLVITLDSEVTKGTGNIELKRSVDDQLITQIEANGSLVSIDGAVATISLGDAALDYGTEYYVLIPKTGFTASGKEFVGVTDKTSWSFITECDDLITNQPQDQVGSIGKSVTFELPEIDGATYQWTYYPFGIRQNLPEQTGKYEGTTTNRLTVLNLDNTDDRDRFQVLVTLGNCSETSDQVFITIGSSSNQPKLISTVPALDATTVESDFNAGGNNFQINFEEPISLQTSAQSGLIQIYDASNDQLLGSNTIPRTGTYFANLSNNDRTLNFSFINVAGNGSVELEAGQEYYILITENHINGADNGTSYTISDPTVWRFSTLALPSTPMLTATSPTDDATDVAILANITLTYSENIQAYVYGEGGTTANNVVLYDVNDNVVETFPANTLTYSGSKVTINPSSDLAYNTAYYLLIENEAFISNNEVKTAAITDPTVISFTTTSQPNTAPVASSVSIAGSLEANLELTGSYNYSDADSDAESGSTLQWYVADDASGANRTAISGATSGTYTLTSSEVGKYITFAVSPNDGTDAGTQTFATYTGPVVAAVVPTVISTIPTDGSVDVAKDANLSFTMRETVTKGTGNITLTPITGIATVIDVTSNEVAISGAEVTINPDSDLLEGQFYTVTFDASAFVDADGNNSAGLTSQTAWNFTVKEANVAPVAQGVSIKKSLVVDGVLEGSYAYSDANDDPESRTTFQWYRADNSAGANRVAIVGETTKSYTVVNDDNGKFVSFEVRPSDGVLTGTVEESTFFGPVLINDGITNIPPAFTSDALTSISDDEAYSYTVTYEDLNNDVPTLTKTTGPDWLTVNGLVLSGNPTSANIGNHSIVLTLDDGNGGTKTQEFTVNVLQSNTAPSVNGVEVSGTTTIDEVLTATYNFIDAELDADNSSFKWYRSEDNSGTGKTEIAGATTTTYVLTAADAGKYISFEVTPNDGKISGTDIESTAVGSIAKKIPSLSLSDISKTYGDADFNLAAITNSSGAVTYTFDNDQTGAAINGSTVTLGNAGEILVNVSLAEDAEYTSRQVQGTITVAKKAIALKATDAGKLVDDTDPTLEFTVTSGSIVGEDEVVTVGRDAGEAPGIYAINLTDGNSAANYEITVVPGVFTISQRSLTITAQAATKTYGDNDPDFAYSITSGSLNAGDELSGAVTRVAGEDVGTYALQSSLFNPNYDISFESADLIIEKTDLTATADDQTKFLGEANPELTISYSGFENGDTKADITEPTIATTATESSPVGTYDITLSGGAAANYNINLVNGQLTVEQRPFIITLDAQYSISREIEVFGVIEGLMYDYTVDWGDGNIDTNLTEAAKHTYTSAGPFTVKVTGNYPGLQLKYFNIKSIEQWGSQEWESLENALQNRELTINATDAPDLSQGPSMAGMFRSTRIGSPDLTAWDVSLITNMSDIFNGSDFNGNVSNWNVSNVTDMSGAFGSTPFNGDISTWNVGNVTTMRSMFIQATDFNGDLSNWDVSSVTNMESVFNNADSFNGDISSWDVSSVTDMTGMFSEADLFNQDISSWDVSNVVDMAAMFSGTKAFNQPIDAWDVSSVVTMEIMFRNADAFNQDLNSWDVSKVEKFDEMFKQTALFNGDITGWDVSSGQDFEEMFQETEAFNQPIGNWNLASATRVRRMFRDAEVFNQPINNWRFPNLESLEQMFWGALVFNQDLNDWDVSNITNMASTFEEAESFNGNISNWDVSKVEDFDEFMNETPFNQDISGWNVSNAKDFGRMFEDSPNFNQDLSNWDMSKATDVAYMFESASSFDQDISSWQLTSVTSFGSMLKNSGLSVENYDAFLISISEQELITDVQFDVEGLQYCAGAAARQSLIDNFNWTIENDSQACSATVTIADVSANEDDGAITVTLTSDAFVVGGFTVDISTSNGTAEAGMDYTAVTSETITFAGTVGETQSFTITPTADSSVESDETLTVSMSNLVTDASNTVTITDEATITILNDDVPVVSFNTTAESNAESVSTASIEVMLSQAGLVASTVDYTVSGTATGGVDYTLANGTLSFAAGELSKRIDLTIVDDALIEENETVVITLSNASGASLGTNTVYTYTIVNNDAQVTIEDVSQFEDGESFLVTATLEGTIEGGFTVDLSTADGTATVVDGDYTAVSGTTLTFIGTDGEVQKLDIAPGVDSKLEADETFTVSLSNLSGTTANVVITDQAVLTIKNDDAAAVTLADASGNEGDGAITVTATLDNAVQGGFTVEVNTADGTATLADSDYTAVAGKTLTFAGTAGETQTFTVTPTNDLVIEANETLTVSMSKLSTALGVDISDGATVTIVNDDFNNAPTDIAISTTSIAENNALNAAIGTLTTADADAGNTHTYALVSGAGDTDNASFTVDGSTLKANNTSFNFEDKASYSVRIETNDGAGGTFAKAFEITVSNVNEAPFTLSLTNATIDEADEAQEVGQLMSLDPDNGDTFTYSLMAGDGDADNAQFAISGNTLSTAGAIDFEDGASRSIRVQVADAGGLTFEQTFSITIEDVVAEPVREYTQNQPGADVKNVFSPNGDGINETWVIEDLLDNPFNQVKIFAQGGKLIYSKVNYSNDWAGTFKDNPVPDGTYYYEILIFENEQSTSPARTIKGFLTIIRNR